jgi:hypothetical protein
MAKPSAFSKLKAAEQPPIAPHAASTALDATQRQASRIGKKTVIFYDRPEAVRDLKRIAVDNDRTVQDLMHEAVDDLLVKYGKHAFGKR